jgi:hypothetical protein
MSKTLEAHDKLISAMRDGPNGLSYSLIDKHGFSPY